MNDALLARQPGGPRRTAQSAPETLIHLCVVCGATAFTLAFVTLDLASRVGRPVLLWPVSGAVLALILPFASRYPKKAIGLIFCAAAGVVGGGIAAGISVHLALIIGLLTAIDLVIGCCLLVSKVCCFEDLKQRWHVIRLGAMTVLAPVLTGLLGALPLSHALKLPVGSTAIMTMLADAIGIVFMVPLIFLLKQPVAAKAALLRHRDLKFVLSVALFLLVTGLVFWQQKGPFLFTIFPPLILLLFEMELEGAVITSLVLSGIAWLATSHGHGPICLVKSAFPYTRFESLQLFIWINAMTALPIGAVMDERRRAEYQAAKAESIRHLILKHASEVIVLSSFDGTERYVSPSIQALAGWTSEEYLSRDRLLNVHADDREAAANFLDQLQLEDLRRFRFRLLHKRGGYKWVDSKIALYGKEMAEGYVATMTDVSDIVESEATWDEERQRLDMEQRRLEEAEETARLQLRLSDDFLSNVSHELRSPLSSIYSFTTIMDDGLASQPSPEQKEYFNIILKNVTQLQAMIEDLLTMTRTREGKLNINLEPVSMSDTVKDVIMNLSIRAKTKGIQLFSTTPDSVPEVLADPIRLHQVLTILIDNAIKFTPHTGSVEVSLREISDGFVMACVSDTGCGIPKEKWSKVFDKLYQTDDDHMPATKTAAGSGLGLGLHIAKTLINQLGGQIWVTSVPSVGSIFHFTIPAASFKETTHVPEALLTGSA